MAVFGTIATSSAYMVGNGQRPYRGTRNNSITGSVGVILQWAEVTELLKNPRRQDGRGHEADL